MALVGGNRLPSARRARPSRGRFVPDRTRARAFGGMFAVHFVLGALVAFGAATAPSAAWAYLALVLFGSLSFGLLRTAPATFLLFVPLIALRLTEFISGAAIEGGADMVETEITGHATGAFARLLLIYLLFFLIASIVVKASWPRLKMLFRDAPYRWQPHGRVIWIGLLIVMSAATAYLLRLGIDNGFPLLDHLDRFAYLRTIDSPIYSAWMTNRPVLVPFIGVLCCVPGYRLSGASVLVWLLALSMLFGEKFTSLLMIVSLFSIPVGLVHIANERAIPIRAIGAIAVAIVVVTVPAVLIAYGALTDLDAAVRKYGQRAALQGQLWYVADDRYLTNMRFDDRAIGADVASWITPAAQTAQDAGTRFGLYYVMQRFTPSRLLGRAMDGGNGFVFSLYPYLLMTMGIAGLLAVSSLLAAFHALVMRMVAQSLAEGNWIASILFGRAMGSLYGGYTTGFLWNFFGIKNLATIAVALFLIREGRRRDSRVRRMMQALASRR